MTDLGIAPLVSMLFVPASDDAKTEKIARLPGSAVILDLEDAVAVSEKSRARERAGQLIDQVGAVKALWVRVNPSHTGLLPADLASVVRPGISGIDLPKVQTPEDVRLASELIAVLEAERGIAPGSVRLMPTIETATGVGNVDEIARSSARIRCLGFGTGDFCLDIGIDVDSSSPTVIAGKIAIVLASRRAGLESPHDSVFIDYQDDQGLREDTLVGKRLGLFGRHAIHPRQIPIIEDVYLPTDEERVRSEALLREFEVAERSGSAAIGFEGALVDYPLAERARRLLALPKRSADRGSDDE